MGLERMATIMQGVDSIFDVDTVKAVRDAVCAKAGVGACLLLPEFPLSGR